MEKFSILFYYCDSIEREKEALYELAPQPAILEANVILLFVGDHHRASQAARLHHSEFDARGGENLLISSVDASLAGQNALLAAESLGYGGVFIGMIRHAASEVAALFHLPDFTYPIFCIALGKPNQDFPVKPRLPHEAVVFDEEYQEQGVDTIVAYDQVQSDYAGARQKESWSERMVSQFGQEEYPATKTLLKEKGLL